MAEIILYIATSLDGFIARRNGSIDWLEQLPNKNQIDHGYGDFLKTIDTLIMGRTTYEQVLSFGMDWPYKGLNTYVVSTKADLALPTEETRKLNLNSGSLDNILKESRKNIWLVGGGKTNTAVLNLGKIDRMILSIIPVVLGEGIPLFDGNLSETYFELIRTQRFETGVVNLTYQKK